MTDIIESFYYQYARQRFLTPKESKKRASSFLKILTQFFLSKNFVKMSVVSSSKDSDDSSLSSADNNGIEDIPHEFRKVRMPRQYIADSHSEISVCALKTLK